MNNQFYPGHRLFMAIGVASAARAADAEDALHAADRAMFDANTRHYQEMAAGRRRSAG